MGAEGLVLTSHFLLNPLAPTPTIPLEACFAKVISDR